MRTQEELEGEKFKVWYKRLANDELPLSTEEIRFREEVQQELLEEEN